MKTTNRNESTGPQKTYLRRLLIEAFSHRYSDRAAPFDHNHLERVTKAEASQAIEALVAAKARGWTKIEPTAEQINAEEARSQAVKVRVARIKELRAMGYKCNGCTTDPDASASECELHTRM